MKKPSLYRLLKIGLMVVGFIALLIFMLTVVFPRREAIADARQSLDSIGNWLLLVRLTLMATVWWYWDTIFEWYFNDTDNASHREALAMIKTKRHTIIGLFLAIEIILVQNVLATFWAWIH
jgi:hypothetical protein